MEGNKFYPMSFNFGGGNNNTRKQHLDDDYQMISGNNNLMMDVSPNDDQMISDDDTQPLRLVSDDDEENLKQQHEDNLDNVIDIYERNYRMEEIKNSNTLLDSKFMEVLDQSFSDSHVVLAKRFEKICERKVQELQEIYQKTYFLPDEQHLKVGKEYTTLKLEKFTWELLYLLFEDEKKSLDNISDHLNQQELKKFVWRVSHKEVVNQMMKTGSEFRKLQIIVNWLEENAKEKVDVENEGAWLFTSRGGEYVDPDSIYKNNNLDENDLRQERIIIKKTWALVRSGQIEEAQKFCRMHNQFWRASTLSGSELYHNPRLMPGACENEETVGNQNRFVYLNTILSILKSDTVNDDEIHQYERAIYGSIAGDLNSILPCCISWEDYLWAYCKSTMLYLINQELAKYVPNDSEDKLYVGSVLDSLKSNSRSLLEIVQSVNTSSNEKIKIDAVQYHHVIQSYIICSQIPNLVQYLLDSVNNPAEYTMSYLANLSRFSAHFILTWISLNGSFEKDECKDAIIVKYIHYLIASKQFESIAFYTKFIHNRNDTNVTYDYRSDVYAKSIIAIEKSEKENSKNLRSMLIAKAKEQGLNIQEIATIVAQKTLEQKASQDEVTNMFDAAFFLDPKNNPLKNLRERQTTELDIKKINSIDWLCIEDINPFNCLLQTNLLIREFIDQGKLGAFELLMKKLHEQLDSKLDDVGLDSRQETIFKEYMFWTLYEKAITTYVSWNTHIKERPTFTTQEGPFRTQADKIKYQSDLSQFNNTILKKWTQENEIFLKQAKDNHLAIVQSPWLTIENVDDSTKQEFAKLKQKCIPDIVFCLYQLLSFAEEYDACMQLADIIADDTRGLYKCFSQKQLIDFLKLMSVCELLFIDKQQKEGNTVN
ncbi:nucleoporin 107 [Naegleria gruberi]|uniref:Nuclear pore complex protein n=1 Tax=Naegleria gruberi TaxID=5762 RepID=D2UZM6_NAEGR|nr:nucleoporin 107 [Naegleria gruberi]EFC50185.1 nucleoporin 107 [Naegleria gruberi]|eukprot:XP_002682929.1 nucleoporin 107 [Naegleria gruberi strain NEG-M]